MKLLLDENISRRILPELDPHFDGSSHVCLVGLERATDDEIWRFAKANGYHIVTCDSDFHELSLIRGSPPKVIWLHAGNLGNAAVGSLLVAAKSQLQDAMLDSAIHFVELSC